MIASLLLSVLQQIVVPSKPDAHQPQLSVAADGHVALAWAEKGVIRCCFGAPDDQSKFLIVHGMVPKMSYSVGMRRGPRVAILDGDQVVLTAIGGELGGGKDGDVWSWCNVKWKTMDGWRKAVRVNSVAGSAREGIHALARSMKGEVYCAWIDLRSGKPQIWGALSKDAGKTWENESVVSGSTEICPCCAPSVAFDAKNGVCVMWRGVREGARDMHLAVSTDGGKTFGAAQKLGSGAWKIDFCPMDGGALALDTEGKLVSAWRRETSVYLSSGADERLVGNGEQPWTAAGAIVWLEKRNARLFALLPGAKDAETLADSANDPVIAAGPDGKGPLYVAWETGSADSSEIRLARLAPR